MNRYRKSVIVVLAGFMVLSGCRKVEISETTMPVQQTETTAAEAVPATQETTLPKGEGVESTDSVTSPVAPDDAQTAATECTDPIENARPTENTKPTESTGPAEETKPTEETKPAENTKPTEEPAPSETTEPSESTESTEGAGPTGETGPADGPCCGYGAYLEMSAAEQQAYMNTFSSPLAFIEWCKSAEAEHEAHDDSIAVEGGDLNVGDYMDKE